MLNFKSNLSTVNGTTQSVVPRFYQADSEKKLPYSLGTTQNHFFWPKQYNITEKKKENPKND